MLRIERATEKSSELDRIRELYKRAFPGNEREPLRPLFEDPTDSSDVLSFFDGDVFCGFACLLTNLDITHILYFAIEESLRGKGYGSAALDAMQNYKPGNRLIADIEMKTSYSDNNKERENRRKFYLRNGYKETGVKFRWRHESYEMLVRGGDLSQADYDGFWENIENKNQLFECYL